MGTGINAFEEFYICPEGSVKFINLKEFPAFCSWLVSICRSKNVSISAVSLFELVAEVSAMGLLVPLFVLVPRGVVGNQPLALFALLGWACDHLWFTGV